MIWPKTLSASLKNGQEKTVRIGDRTTNGRRLPAKDEHIIRTGVLKYTDALCFIVEKNMG